MRYYLPATVWSDGEMDLAADDAHHALHVLRVGEGAAVDLFDGAGRTGRATVVRAQRRRVTVRLDRVERQPRPPLRVTLVQALAREQKMDLIIQKAVELGAAAVQPVRSEHAVVRLSGAQAEKKAARWSRIAVNAGKQCGAAWLTAVAPVVDLGAYLAEMPRFDLLLFCALAPEARPLRDILRPAATPGEVAVFVGPEGDFSVQEKRGLEEAGAVPVSLGRLVLRSETAALYALSALHYEWGATG